MTEETRPSEFDPDLPGALADPDVLYGPLRREHPVAWSSAYGGFWAATRYRDIERITTDPETFTTSQGIIVPRNPASGRRPPLHYDPPEHTVYRKAINPTFRKDRLGRMEPLIDRHAIDLLGALEADGVRAFDAYHAVLLALRQPGRLFPAQHRRRVRSTAARGDGPLRIRPT